MALWAFLSYYFPGGLDILALTIWAFSLVFVEIDIKRCCALETNAL